jgi:hypothetical protein
MFQVLSLDRSIQMVLDGWRNSMWRHGQSSLAVPVQGLVNFRTNFDRFALSGKHTHMEAPAMCKNIWLCSDWWEEVTGTDAHTAIAPKAATEYDFTMIVMRCLHALIYLRSSFLRYVWVCVYIYSKYMTSLPRRKVKTFYAQTPAM